MAIDFKLPETGDKLFRGDTVIIEMTITEDDAPLDLTGCEIWFTMKKAIGDADGAPGAVQKTLVSGITTPDIANGLIRITILPADTANNSAAQTYQADVQIKKTSSGSTETVARGTIAFEEDVTRAS